MRRNKIKDMMKDGKPVINGWLSIPSTVSAEAMAHQGWDSLTIDLQHGLVDYTNALPMLQAVSSTNVTPLGLPCSTFPCISRLIFIPTLPFSGGGDRLQPYIKVLGLCSFLLVLGMSP